MGHERVGSLPKTQKWQTIVRKISNYSAERESIAEIATQTSRNVRNRFSDIENDGGVFAAFKYILTLTYASKTNAPFDVLADQKIDLPANFSLYDLASSIHNYVDRNSDSKEYSSFATQSMIDTVSEWAKQQNKNQIALFDSTENGLELWNKAANGAGFCELSRLFFSKFTERYLKYFLEREAAANIDNLYDRNQFTKKLENHINQISKHAFETAKITQSFAAGWYNKEVRTGLPANKKIKGFLSFAFKKINSELLREESNDDKLQ